MTRFRIRYSIFSSPHDSDEFFTKFEDADAFLTEHGDPSTDAVISWPDADEDEEN